MEEVKIRANVRQTSGKTVKTVTGFAKKFVEKGKNEPFINMNQ